MRLAFIAATLVLLAGAPGAAAQPSRCAAPGSRDIATGHAIRVYQRHGRVTACLRASGRRRVLGLAPSAEGCFPDDCSVGNVRVAGELVGYSADEGGRYGVYDRVRVLDLRTGRTVVDTPAGDFHHEDEAACSANGESTYVGLGFVTDLLLRSDGTVGWIAERICGPGQPSEVWLRTAQRRVRLDHGGRVGPTSLAFSPGAVAWTEDGAPRTAPLAVRAAPPPAAAAGQSSANGHPVA